MPRYYTIASSSLAHPTELTLAVSLSTIETGLGKTRDGLTSGYLNDIFTRMQAGEEVKETSKAFVNASNFVQAPDHSTPLIMVGPGTGVVPYIGFMQEREQAKKDNAELQLGPASLYFGCRQQDSDFIYRDEMASFYDHKVIDSLNVALSRPKEDGAKKQYVQDILRGHQDLVKTYMLEKGGHFFVCGATKMGKDVEALVREIVGEDEFKKLQAEKRYKVELWSS